MGTDTRNSIVDSLIFKYNRFGQRRYADSVEITAKRDDYVVGAVNFDISKPPKSWGCPPSIQITDIKVDHDYRGGGIATRLVQEIINHHPGVPIYTNFQTEDGERLFPGLGIGRTPDSYHPTNRLVVQKNIVRPRTLRQKKSKSGPAGLGGLR